MHYIDTMQNIQPNASQRKRLSMIGTTVITHRQVRFTLVRFTKTTVSVNSRYPHNRRKHLKPRTEIVKLTDTSTQLFELGEYFPLLDEFLDSIDSTKDYPTLNTIRTDLMVKKGKACL